jgi:outer membrane protein
MKIKKSSFLILPFMLLLICNAPGQAIKTVKIGLIIDGTWGEENQMLESIKREIHDLTGGEFDVQFPADKTIQTDWTIRKIRSGLDRLLVDPDVDMIITLGSISSNEVCHRSELAKPVIAPYIIDASFQKLPIKNGKSNIKNLNYISAPATFKRDIQIFKDIVPFRKLAVFINQYFLDAFPGLDLCCKETLEELNLNVKIIGIGTSIQQAMDKVPSDIEAVYILPLPHFSDDQYKKLADALIDRKLPSFAYGGAERVEQGILAGLNKDVVNRISRRVGINVQRILLGEKPEQIPVAISIHQQLTINEATANAIGVSPSWAVITEAEIVGREQRPIDRVLDLNRVVQEAINANLDLIAKGYTVEAGKQNVNEARAKLMPSLDISGTYLVIDKDLAERSFGQQAERMLTGSATATQVIFSEPAWVNLSIQKNLQRSREFDLEQLKLDITLEAVTSYLNVLRAKTAEKIQQENIKVTRQNLDFARVREAVGSAGPAEVYRWESEIAINRKAVIEANAQRNLAEIQLNRVLHRPAEEDFLTQEIGLNDPNLITSYGQIFKYIENKQAFKVFREFMVDETFKNSPELAALDAAIAVQKRILRSATNNFWSPTIALQGQVTNTYSRAGIGKEATLDLSQIPTEFRPIGEIFAQSFKPPKDLSWNVGLTVSFPLFRSGQKFFVRQKALNELNQLQTQRDATAEKIEQRVRSALHIAGASHASIQQARLAAEAAQKSLQVIQESYSQGLLSVVELLDAQYAALVTDQVAANAVDDFLIDLMEVERAYGHFNFFSTDERRKAFFERSNQYFMKEGVSIK